MPIPIYSIKDLKFSQSGNEIFIKQFDIHRGACYVFEGKIGSGKTTLLDVLYSRKRINNGEIDFEQKPINSYSKKEYESQIAIVPQKFSPPWGSVENYILKTINKYSHIKNINKHFDSIVNKMKLSLLLKRRMKTLTPGEIRWVVLAAQIASDAKVLFIDEYELHLGKDEMNILNKEDLLKEFQKTVVSCKDVEFTLFGLSLATINAIISFILSVITFKLFLSYEKNK